MSCWAVSAPGSSASAASARSSSSRVARIRAALGRSGSPGSRPLTLRAFTARRRLDQLAERVAQLAEPLLGHERRQPLVRLPLLLAEPGQEDLQPPPVGGRRLLQEAGEEGDRDVAVAALAERVGKRLDLLQRPLVALAREAGPEHLQRRPQAAARDPHVVQRLDVVEVEDAARVLEDLAGADLDHPRRRQREGLLAVEPGYVARPCHGIRLALGAGGLRRRGARARSRWRCR